MHPLWDIDCFFFSSPTLRRPISQRDHSSGRVTHSLDNNIPYACHTQYYIYIYTCILCIQLPPHSLSIFSVPSASKFIDRMCVRGGTTTPRRDGYLSLSATRLCDLRFVSGNATVTIISYYVRVVKFPGECIFVDGWPEGDVRKYWTILLTQEISKQI